MTHLRNIDRSHGEEVKAEDIGATETNNKPLGQGVESGDSMSHTREGEATESHMREGEQQSHTRGRVNNRDTHEGG